jgi:hypothetical protein
MEKDQEKLYIQMAREHPDIICSDVPVEILEAAAFSGEEPTNFMDTINCNITPTLSLDAAISCLVSQRSAQDSLAWSKS